VLQIQNMDVKQKMLGLVILTTSGCRFYFAETNIGKGITSGNDEYTNNARKYLVDYYNNSITLTDVLIKAGAKIVEDKDATFDEKKIKEINSGILSEK